MSAITPDVAHEDVCCIRFERHAIVSVVNTEIVKRNIGTIVDVDSIGFSVAFTS